MTSETNFKSEIENEITIETIKIECEEDGFLKDGAELHSTDTQDDTFDKKLDFNTLEKVSHQKTSPIDSKCNSCNETFSSSKELSIHKRKVHKDKKFNCDSCGKSYSEAGN